MSAPCMHWHVVHLHREDGVVTRRCLDCSAEGDAPTCSGTTMSGRRCRKWVDQEGMRCRHHGREMESQNSFDGGVRR